MVIFNLEQIVRSPTRESNTCIFDLFLTKQPSQVHTATTLPPLATSHTVVVIEINQIVGRPLQAKRKIKLFKKLTGNLSKLNLMNFTNYTCTI